MDLSKESFYKLEKQVRETGFSADMDKIKHRLLVNERISADEFANRAIYVVLASGFKYQTARKKHQEIMLFLHSYPLDIEKSIFISELLKIFKNKNKINAIATIWQNRETYHKGYFSLKNAHVEAKLSYLMQLPYIGQITKNHLARK